MKRYFLLILFFLVEVGLFSQNNKIFKIGDTIFYDKYNRITNNNTNKFIVVKSRIYKKGKPNYNVDMYKLDRVSNKIKLFTNFNSTTLEVYASNGKQIYYHKNGVKKAEGITKNNRKDGVWRYWYSDGKKQSEYKYFAPKKTLKKVKSSILLSFWDRNGKQTVTNGTGSYFYISENDSSKHEGKIIKYKKEGIWKAIRKDGSKIYQEVYKKGRLIKGESWDKDGKKYSYKKAFIQPQFKRGMKGIKKIIMNNFKVPQFAIDHNIQGTMIVSFMVDKKGKVENPKVVRKLCVPCDIEAVRVVKLMKNWKPAVVRGKKIKAKYSIPLTIKFN